jgi:hypothetical protein
LVGWRFKFFYQQTILGLTSIDFNALGCNSDYDPRFAVKMSTFTEYIQMLASISAAAQTLISFDVELLTCVFG